MLTDAQLQDKVYYPQNKTREELIKELVQKDTDTKIDTSSLPTNLNSLSIAKLRELCICAGIPFSNDKDKMICDIQQNSILMLN